MRLSVRLHVCFMAALVSILGLAAESSASGPLFWPARMDYPAGARPYSVFGADLDGDGDIDLAVANYYDDDVSILLNNGDGTFALAVNYGAGNYPSSVFGADVDGDGDTDLAVANYMDNDVSILLNNGDGTFALAVNYGAGSLSSSVFAALGTVHDILTFCLSHHLPNPSAVLIFDFRVSESRVISWLQGL